MLEFFYIIFFQTNVIGYVNSFFEIYIFSNEGQFRIITKNILLYNVLIASFFFHDL